MLNFKDKQEMESVIETAVRFVRSHTDCRPEIAVVLGSGLGGFADSMRKTAEIPFSEIPGFPPMTVEGHSGKFLFGEIAGKTVAVMQGRYHYYEGYETQEITVPIRVLGCLGVRAILLTNACGGINPSFAPGDLMVIEDHIGFLCPPALRGAHLDKYGPRFTDMSRAYDPDYAALAEACAESLGIRLRRGVYAYWPGPTYETAAEIRAFQALGADAVGMSTVPETAVAVNQGMRVLGISAITNMTCAVSRKKTSHEEVMEMGNRMAGDFLRLITGIIERITF